MQDTLRNYIILLAIFYLRNDVVCWYVLVSFSIASFIQVLCTFDGRAIKPRLVT